MMVPICEVGVGGDGANLRDHVAGYGLRKFRERATGDGAVFRTLAHNCLNSLVDATLQRCWVRAGSNGFYTFAVNGLRQHGRGCGAVTGNVGGLGSDFLDELGTDILDGILELDLLGNGHAVFGDGRRSELFLDYHIAALGTECDFDGVGEYVHAAQNSLARIFAVQNCLCHYYVFLCALGALNLVYVARTRLAHPLHAMSTISGCRGLRLPSS